MCKSDLCAVCVHVYDSVVVLREALCVCVYVIIEGWHLKQYI